MGSFVAALDATVVNVALPSIQDDLGGGLAGQQWVSNAYLLMLGSLILVGGALGDRFGARRIFALGVSGFGAASLLCAAAPSVELLVAARALQGVFGALLTPSALAVIVFAFPPAERGAAIGSWTAWSGIAMILGPFTGGWLVDVASWRWVFLVNVPFVLVTLALVRTAIPPAPSRTAARPPLDWPGAVLGALGLAGPVYGLIRQPVAGWTAGDVLVPILGGVAVLVTFVVREARTAHPMLPLGLFRRRNFAVGNLQTLTIYGGLTINLFLLVLYLQQVAGYSALHAGLATLPTTAVMFTLSRRFGALADRFGPRAFMGGGPLVAAAGLLWISRLGADVRYATDLLPGLLVFALGLSITVAPLTATVLADADDQNAGIASGINNAIARVAGLLTVAALGAAVATSFGTTIDRELQGTALSPAGRSLVATARRQTLARADTAALAPAEAAAVSTAVRRASVRAFRRGMTIAAGLVALGGVLGLAGVANPRRRVGAAGCAGGQVVGTPGEAGGVRGADSGANRAYDAPVVP